MAYKKIIGYLMPNLFLYSISNNFDVWNISISS